MSLSSGNYSVGLYGDSTQPYPQAFKKKKRCNQSFFFLIGQGNEA